MRTSRRRSARLLALALPCLLLPGCGARERTTVVGGSVVRLRLEEYRIVPQLVQVRAGRLKIVAYNAGLISHNVKVELAHRDSAGQPVVLGGTATAGPGEQVEVKIFLRPGRYMLADTVGNHVDLGQFGTLVVK